MFAWVGADLASLRGVDRAHVWLLRGRTGRNGDKGWVLMVFCLLSLGGSCQLCAAAVAGVPSAGTSGVSSRLVVGWAGSSASAITAPAAAMPAAT